MSGNLFSDLVSKPQREIAGSDSAARFDYQKDWAFCRMMRKHISGEDYLVAFEYHDDILFLAPSDTPANAEFCQVKTSSASSPRKLSSLTTRPKGKASILAKMFSNFDGICSSHDVRVILVSNNAFEFAEKEVCAKDLDEKFRKKLVEKLQAEIPGFDQTRLKKLHFMVTGVSLEAMQSFLEGEAMELFCQKFGEDHGLNVRTWIRLLKGEIARKNNYPSDQITNANDLIHYKCVDQPFVENTLNVMHSKTQQPLDVGAISSYLADAGWNQVDVMRFQKKIPQANNDYYDPLNKDVKEIAKFMRAKVRGEDKNPVELTNFLEEVAREIGNNTKVFHVYRQKEYLHALGALVYYEEI